MTNRCVYDVGTCVEKYAYPLMVHGPARHGSADQLAVGPFLCGDHTAALMASPLHLVFLRVRRRLGLSQESLVARLHAGWADEHRAETIRDGILAIEDQLDDLAAAYLKDVETWAARGAGDALRQLIPTLKLGTERDLAAALPKAAERGSL